MRTLVTKEAREGAAAGLPASTSEPVVAPAELAAPTGPAQIEERL